jgi:hypothetical protein
MSELMAAAIAARGVSLYSGARLDFMAPRKETIFLRDIAECLSRTDAAFADSGFYSLAQRSSILAEQIAKSEGPHAACYALLWYAGLALIRSLSPFDLCGDGLGGMRRSYDQLMEVAHDALDIDWPVPVPASKAIHAVHQQLLLRELVTLRHNVDVEIMRLRHQGVVPLAAHLMPLPRERAFSKWVGTWKVMAHAACLPVTPAWQGL